MKKIFILIFSFTLILITGSNTFAIDTYGYNLNMPLSEFDGYTLKEVFENRNQSMPDLDGKTEISTGVYRVNSIADFTIDYNVLNGNIIYNGSVTSTGTYGMFGFTLPQGIYTLSIQKVSGTQTSGILVDTYLRTSTTPLSNLYIIDEVGVVNNITYNTTENVDLYLRFRGGIIYDNYTFKLQLEKGSTATPYQVPTSGPYNQFDFGLLDLTLQQIEYYFDIYTQLQVPYYNTFFDNIIIIINDITNHTQSTIQETFDYLYDGENLTYTGQIVTIFFSTALIASILILLFRSWRF